MCLLQNLLFQNHIIVCFCNVQLHIRLQKLELFFTCLNPCAGYVAVSRASQAVWLMADGGAGADRRLWSDWLGQGA
ncbi:MAG: hypothetical protein EBZ51_12300 [Synechococcaceae bacterium WB9_2_112]|nr:hypothetical protein [Synechococcaceae bacterium WB9_2_112]